MLNYHANMTWKTAIAAISLCALTSMAFGQSHSTTQFPVPDTTISHKKIRHSSRKSTRFTYKQVKNAVRNLPNIHPDSLEVIIRTEKPSFSVLNPQYPDPIDQAARKSPRREHIIPVPQEEVMLNYELPEIAVVAERSFSDIAEQIAQDPIEALQLREPQTHSTINGFVPARIQRDTNSYDIVYTQAGLPRYRQPWTAHGMHANMSFSSANLTSNSVFTPSPDATIELTDNIPLPGLHMNASFNTQSIQVTNAALIRGTLIQAGVSAQEFGRLTKILGERFAALPTSSSQEVTFKTTYKNSHFQVQADNMVEIMQLSKGYLGWELYKKKLRQHGVFAQLQHSAPGTSVSIGIRSESVKVNLDQETGNRKFGTAYTLRAQGISGSALWPISDGSLQLQIISDKLSLYGPIDSRIKKEYKQAPFRQELNVFHTSTGIKKRFGDAQLDGGVAVDIGEKPFIGFHTNISDTAGPFIFTVSAASITDYVTPFNPSEIAEGSPNFQPHPMRPERMREAYLTITYDKGTVLASARVRKFINRTHFTPFGPAGSSTYGGTVISGSMQASILSDLQASLQIRHGNILQQEINNTPIPFLKPTLVSARIINKMTTGDTHVYVRAGVQYAPKQFYPIASKPANAEQGGYTQIDLGSELYGEVGVSVKKGYFQASFVLKGLLEWARLVGLPLPKTYISANKDAYGNTLFYERVPFFNFGVKYTVPLNQ